MVEDIAAAGTATLASHLKTIDPECMLRSVFVAAGFRRAPKLQYCCQEADVPTVPKNALRLILAKRAGMEF